MLRLHGSYQLDQLSNREVGQTIMKMLLYERDEFRQFCFSNFVVCMLLSVKNIQLDSNLFNSLML